MAGLGLAIGALGLNAASGIAGLFGAKRKQKRAFNYQSQLNREQAQLNYDYGEMSAENAHQRTLALRADDQQREDTQIQRQVEDAQAAGISPSVFGGMGGAGGGGGGAGGAQGGGARGGQPVDAAAIIGALNEKRALNIDAQRQRTEDALAVAEAAVKKAEAKAIRDENERENARLGGDVEEQEARINNILEDIRNKKVQRQGYKLQNAFDEVRNEIQNESKKTQVWKIEAEYEELQEKVKGLTIDNDIKESIENDLIEYAREQTKNLIADTIEKYASSALTNEQRKSIRESLDNEKGWLKLSKDELLNRIKEFGITIKENKKDRIHKTVGSVLSLGGILGAAKIHGSQKGRGGK